MQPSAEELLRSALVAAFPDRGEMLYREVRRWFDDSSAAKLPPAERPASEGPSGCVLCDRPGKMVLAIVRLVPGTKKKKPQFLVPGLDTSLDPPRGVLHACSNCIGGYSDRVAEFGPDPAKWPHPDMVLTDARRALEADGSEAAAALADEIDERSAPRRVGTGTCDVCHKKKLAVGGPRGRICLSCVQAANDKWKAVLAMFARLGSNR